MEKKNSFSAILLVIIGFVLIISGIVVETKWRQNPKYTNYDNAGPGYYLGFPGAVLLFLGWSRSRKDTKLKQPK